VGAVTPISRKLSRIPRAGEVVLLGTAAISVISVIWIESTIGSDSGLEVMESELSMQCKSTTNLCGVANGSHVVNASVSQTCDPVGNSE
jgi:hypothetical protein